MPASPRPRVERHSEAERLILLARSLLESSEDEIVALYLDQALETLQVLAERSPDEAD